MASWVSPKIDVKDHGPMGIGTFAKDHIARGELLIVQGGIMVHDSDFDHNDYPYPDHWYTAFQVSDHVYICPATPDKSSYDGIFKVNHSCEPNCGINGQIELVAMRDILPGDEITFDYAMTDASLNIDDWIDMECLCGKKACRQKITGEDWRLPHLRKSYKGYFSTYIQRLIDNSP